MPALRFAAAMKITLSVPAALLVAAVLLAAPPASAATAVDAPTRTVKVGTLTVGYRSIGAGPAVVFIQGLSGTMDAWDPPLLDAIAASGHRVVVFDNEGIGRSTPSKGDLTIARMADTTAGLIAALELGTPDVIGWSMGGMIAQSLAVRHPNRLRRLVLLATAPGDGAAKPPRADALDALTKAGDPTQILRFVFPPGQEASRDRYLGDILKRRGFVPTAPAQTVARQVAASGTWLSGGDPDGAGIARLKLPVLVGGGVKDWLLPVDNQRHIAKVIPGAKRILYRDAAHGFYLQHADTFVPRLAKFLRPDR